MGFASARDVVNRGELIAVKGGRTEKAFGYYYGNRKSLSPTGVFSKKVRLKIGQSSL